MRKIILVQIEERLRQGIVQGTKDITDLDVTQALRVDAALELVEPSAADVDAVVVGAAVSEPLRLIQRLHMIDRDLSVVLLSEPRREPELRHALRFMPYLGSDVTYLDADDPEKVARTVVQALERRRQRHRYAETAARINRRLGEAMGSPQIATHFDRLLDHAPVGVVTVGQQGTIYGWNRHAQNLLERSERQMLGQPLSLLFAMPEREQVRDYLAQVIAGAELPPTTFDRSLIKGQPQHLELSAVAVELEPQRPGAIVLLQDVTAREQAREQRDRVEEALRQQRRWFQATILSIGDAVIATDERGRITLMNDVAERLTGWTLSEASGQNSERVFHIVHEYTRKPVESPVARVLQDGKTAGLANHTILIARDGTEIPIDDSGAPIRDSEGNLIGTVLVFRDIRERRSAEQAMRASEQRFRAIFEQVAVGIALVTPRAQITHVNDRFCQIVGYSREELLAMDDPVAFLTHPDDMTLDLAHFETLIAGEKSAYQLEKRYIHKDGHVVWVNLTASALRDAAGGIEQLIGVVEDITERKSAEEALQASEERMRLILESLTDYAIFTMDIEGRVTSWNTGAQRLLGYEASEIVGQPADILFTAQDRRDRVPGQELREAMNAGRAADDRWHLRKDGTHFWANGLMSALGEGREAPQGFVKILRDQTEAKRSREQLEARARQQAAVARFGQRALAEPELSNLLDEVTKLVTQTLEVPLAAVLHLVPEERRLEMEAGVGWEPNLVGRTSLDADHSQAGYTLHTGAPVVAEDFKRETRFTPSQLLLEHGVVSAMSVLIAGPGEGAWGVLSAHAREHRLFTNDDVNFLQAMANILATAIWRSRTEQQLRDFNQTLEQRVAERTAEAEQRAVQLRALTSELTQTEQRERRRLAQVLHDHLQQMLVAGKLQLGVALNNVHEKATASILQRVNDLLDRSIQESRSLTVELSPPVLYDAGLVAGLEWLGRWMKEQHGLTVEVDADAQADPHGNDLRVLLFQAARELLFNVVKHAEVDRAEVTLRRKDDHRIVMNVCDQGQGFDLRTAERSENDRGGFGLFSIRERLAWLGGEFNIDSTPSEGTCATIVVPEKSLAQGAAETIRRRAEPSAVSPALRAASEAAAAPPSERIRVVLADDHEIIRDGLVGILNTQPDIEVVGEADNGHAAFELARQLRPDVVVLDVTMPRMNGIEAARLITNELPDVHVVGLSMHESADMAEAMRAAGAATYLNKAGPSERLIAAIRAHRA